MREHTLPGIRQGTVAWGDYDRDGDLDVVLAGVDDVDGGVAGLYRNDGPGAPGEESWRFERVQALPATVYGAAAWGDYDGDNDLDLVVQGSTTVQPPYAPVTTLYRNDGGTLVALEAGLVGLHSGATAWADYDRDGDLDLLLTGEAAPEEYRTVLYRNDGGDRFAEVETGLPGLGYSDAAWGDYDRDGDPDLALMGVSETGLFSGFYLNQRNQGFVRADAPLVPAAFGSVAWGDGDGDGDLDLLLTGGRMSTKLFTGQSVLYVNNGGRLTASNQAFVQTLTGAATWGDYDDDGDLDILVVGLEEVYGERAAEIYENDGRGRFAPKVLLYGAGFAAADWGDFDADGDLDLLATGQRPGGPAMAMLYENVRLLVRPPPPAPALRPAAVEAGGVALAWDVADLPPDATFNLRVGTTPGGTDVVAPMAEPATGRRHLAASGNAGRLLEWRIENLPDGAYYWSVQALNGAYVASAFAAEGSFRVTGGATVSTDAPAELPTRFAAYANYPNPFAGATTLRYDLPAAATVVLTVYNVLGEVVWQEQHAQSPGTHTFVWEGQDRSGGPVGAGLYLYELRAGTSSAKGTMVRLK